MKVEETIQRLLEKADHPATPNIEAETCRRMAGKLERRLGRPTESSHAAFSEEIGWDSARMASARSHAVGQAFREYGPSFDPNRWSDAYDRSVQAQRSAKIKFDAYLAFEHARNQYDADCETDIKLDEDLQAAAAKLQAASDLDLAHELARLSHGLLEVQMKMTDARDREQRPNFFSRTTARGASRIVAQLERQYQTSMERFRAIEGELERRNMPVEEPELVEEPVAYRFFVNPTPA